MQQEKKSLISTTAQLHQNQPYDESLDIPDAEEVASITTPTPLKPSLFASKNNQDLIQEPIEGNMSDTTSDIKYGNNSDEDDDADLDEKSHLAPTVARPSAPQRQPESHIHYSEGEDSGSSDEEDEEDDDQVTMQEGAYDPTEFESLKVTKDIKDLFQYIVRYTPQVIDLDFKLKPFIPDFIPAVGDIDAFIKVTRCDGKPDILGLTVLDEPCAKQSDPTILDLQLRAISKQSLSKDVAVKCVEDAMRNTKEIDRWISSIQQLHRAKPPASVHYSKNMPDIETLMQEWPSEFEELLKEVELPSADHECDLSQYIDIISAILDIPIHPKSGQHSERVQALHVLFTLFSEFKHSPHFRQMASTRSESHLN